MTGWKNRSWRTQPLYSESGERIQETDRAEAKQNTADKTEQRQTKEGSLDTPVRDPPGHHAGYEPRGEDQENCRAEDSKDLPIPSVHSC
jgi:hypothetical protein